MRLQKWCLSNTHLLLLLLIHFQYSLMNIKFKRSVLIFICSYLNPGSHCNFFLKSFRIVLDRHDDRVTLWDLSCHKRQENLLGVLHYQPYTSSDCGNTGVFKKNSVRSSTHPHENSGTTSVYREKPGLSLSCHFWSIECILAELYISFNLSPAHTVRFWPRFGLLRLIF